MTTLLVYRLDKSAHCPLLNMRQVTLYRVFKCQSDKHRFCSVLSIPHGGSHCQASNVSWLQVVTAVKGAAKQLGLSQKQMVSRAYHDSLFMAQIAPAGMIFIPCKNGWSHRPDEYASPGDIENGVKTLALTLAELAGSAASERSEL